MAASPGSPPCSRCLATLGAACSSVAPSHYELAAAAYYSGVPNWKRRKQVVPGGLRLLEVKAVEDRLTGLRVLLFIGEEQAVPEGGGSCPECGAPLPERLAPAVFAFRGTRATHRGNLAADYGILRHNRRGQELAIAEEARAVVADLMLQLQADSPGTRHAWFACGHSLGGFLATTITICLPEIHQCVVFEAPGCPKLYLSQAETRGSHEYWREKITCYVTLPNPINMHHKHIGRVVRVELDLMDSIDSGHVVKCLAASMFRWLNWLSLLLIMFIFVELMLGLSLYSSITRLCAVLDGAAFSKWAPIQDHFMPHICMAGLGEITLMNLLSAATLSFKGTTAFLATRIGTTVPFQLSAHKLSNIIRSFCPHTGAPKRCIEMASWPQMKCMKRCMSRDLWLIIWELFIPSPSSESIWHLFDRQRLLNSRVALLPGYKELTPGATSQHSMGE
eukprot:jgi/Tetstr1/453793/TSEL_040745.t1